MKHFGEHVTIDGYDGDFDLLNSQDGVKKALVNLTSDLGMKILGGPVVYFAQGNDKKDPGGWSGVVVIEESHISMHTFPARRFISADVYTCQNGLDVKKITDFFKRTFKVKDEEVHFIRRGIKYPDSNIDYK
jgi:S-adenosylmethionine decarboxylase